MAERARIAIIGLPPLMAAAIRGIAYDCGNPSIIISATLGEIEASADRIDMYIVDIVQYVARPEFFLPRKSRVVLRFPYYVDSSEMPVRVICDCDSEASIRSMLSSVISAPDKPKTSNNVLTAREIDTLREIARGKTNKEIADTLNISVNTVITHRKNISRKLGIKSASGLSLFAMMHGLV